MGWDYLKDDAYSDVCGFSFMEAIFAHVSHAERYFYERIDELSSPQVPRWLHGGLYLLAGEHG